MRNGKRHGMHWPTMQQRQRQRKKDKNRSFVYVWKTTADEWKKERKIERPSERITWILGAFCHFIPCLWLFVCLCYFAENERFWFVLRMWPKCVCVCVCAMLHSLLICLAYKIVWAWVISWKFWIIFHEIGVTWNEL